MKILAITVLLLFAVIASAEPISTSNTVPTVCKLDSVNARMPTLVFEYLRMSAALEQNRFDKFKQISTALDEPQRSPASLNTSCGSLEAGLNRVTSHLGEVKNLDEANQSMDELRKLIALWGFYTKK